MAWSPVPGYVHAANPSSISQSADYILLLDIEKDAAVERRFHSDAKITYLPDASLIQVDWS